MRDPDDPYLIEAGAKILDVLNLFHTGREHLTLTEVASLLRLPKSTTFRLLYTLEKKGYVERSTHSPRYQRRRKRKVGYAAISSRVEFAVEVTRSLVAEAGRSGVELLVAYNEFDAHQTLDNVRTFLASGVDLLVEYNADEHVSHLIADLCSEAHVPVVAITFPVPGATTFGVNNYRSGLVGGEGLGQHIASAWRGEFDQIVVLDIQGSSPSQQARITGMLDGLRRFVEVPSRRTLHLHAESSRSDAMDLVEQVLRMYRKPRRIVIISFNDHNALAALRAVENVRHPHEVLLLSQGGAREVRQQLRNRQSALWGTVSHFPERFGNALLPVILRILNGDPVPNIVLTPHALITRSNINQYYPTSPK